MSHEASSKQKKRILVIEDEPDVRTLLRHSLAAAGYIVMFASQGLEGLKLARKSRPHAIVLDRMLPGKSGEDVCRELKSDPATAGIPIVMLTAKASPEDRVTGLEIGADDYIAKPFSPRELVLRLQTCLLRRTAPPGGDVLVAGPLELDRRTLGLRVEGQRVDLTSIEFKMLALLIEHQGTVRSREELLLKAWGYRSVYATRTVDTHVRRLRIKLGTWGSMLRTVHGEGYCLHV